MQAAVAELLTRKTVCASLAHIGSRACRLPRGDPARGIRIFSHYREVVRKVDSALCIRVGLFVRHEHSVRLRASRKRRSRRSLVPAEDNFAAIQVSPSSLSGTRHRSRRILWCGFTDRRSEREKNSGITIGTNVIFRPDGRRGSYEIQYVLGRHGSLVRQPVLTHGMPTRSRSP